MREGKDEHRGREDKVLVSVDDNVVCQAGDLLRPGAGLAAARCLVFTHVCLEGFYPLLSSHCVNIVALPLLSTNSPSTSLLPTAQFDGAEWDRSSSPTERLRPLGPRSSPLAGGGMKFRMPQEGLSLVGERVDPALPLEKQVYVRSGSAEAAGRSVGILSD